MTRRTDHYFFEEELCTTSLLTSFKYTQQNIEKKKLPNRGVRIKRILRGSVRWPLWS